MSDEKLYLQAQAEIDDSGVKPDFWAKALVQCQGDEGAARYRYVELRVEALRKSGRANRILLDVAIIVLGFGLVSLLW